MSLFSRARLLKILDATIGYATCKILGRVRHHAGLPELAPTPDFQSLTRILVIRPGGMGDMLMLLPVLQAMRDANASLEIDIVCEKRNAPVLALAGLGGGAILYDANPIACLQRLRGTSYDAVIDTEQFHNFSAVMAWFSGAPVRVGFKMNPARLALYTHLVSYNMDGYEMAQFARLLEPFDISLGVDSLHGTLAEAANALPMHVPPGIKTLTEAGPIIVIAPGSNNPYKHWDAGKCSELISRLDGPQRSFVLVGGNGEIDAEVVARAEVESLVDTCGTLDLEQTASILNSATLYIGCDSGLTHLATALGKPTIALFGPSDDEKWSRPHETHRVIRKDLPCSPCSIFGYNKLCREIACMRGISVDEVLSAAEAFLGE